LAAHLVALVREHLNDTGEDAIDELTGDFLLGVGGSLSHFRCAVLHTLGHQEALLHLLEDSLFLLLLPFDGLSGLESALNGSNAGTKSLTGAVNESCESRNARLNHGLMRLRDFFILAEPRVVLHPLHNKRLHVLVRGILDRLEGDDEVDQIAVLLPDTSEVLAVSLVLDPLELGLEVQSVTHLVEQEGEEEVAPARLEGHEAGQFVLVHGVGKGVAARQ